MKKKICRIMVYIAICFCSIFLMPLQAKAEEFHPAIEVEKEEENGAGFHEYYLKQREYATFEEAQVEIGKIGRHFAFNRVYADSTIYISFRINTENGAEKYIFEEENGELCFNDTFLDVAEGVIAEEGTGNPQGGNFLREEYHGVFVVTRTLEYKDGGYQGVVFVNFPGVTPQAEYEAFLKETADILEGLNLEGKTEYEKTMAIGNWLAMNLEYEKVKERGASIAVSALKYRTCDCTGYAILFYYLGIASGLDVLYDYGYSAAAGHAWNLVKMEDGKYYSFDPQAFSPRGSDQLRGSKDNGLYSTAGYEGKYDLAEYMYSKEHSPCQGEHYMQLMGGGFGCFPFKRYACVNEDCLYEHEEPTGEENHTWSEQTTVTQEADCTHPELTTFKCKHKCLPMNLPATKTEETAPALGHAYGEASVVAPTCTEKGYTGKSCSRCGEEQRTAETEALGHEYRTDETLPTCTADGFITYRCTRCENTYTEPSGETATGHHYEDQITTEAQCTAEGIRTYTCTGCQDIYEEAIEALGHDYQIKETVPATCEEHGQNIYECSRCKETNTERNENAPTGHTWNEGTITKNASCTEPGTRTFACASCEKTKEVSIPERGHGPYETRDHLAAGCEESGYSGDTYCEECNTLIEEGYAISSLGHSYGDRVVIKEPTYDTPGLEEYICSVCQNKKQVILPQLKHEHGGFEIKTIRKSSCKETGIERRQCMSCDFYYEIEIPKTSHGKAVIRNKKEATCKESGYSGDKVCSVCDTVLESGRILSLLEHSFDSGRITKQATCKEEGIRTFTCTGCGEEKTESIPVRAVHVWDHGVITKKETCSTEGEKQYSCTICGTTKKENVPATNQHIWDEGTITKKASCTQFGELTKICGECRKEKVETMQRLPHTFGRWSNRSAATVFQKATRERQCSMCGNTEKESYGSTVKATLSVNAGSLKLKTKQSTNKFVVGFAAGDSVRSWVSSNKKIVTVSGQPGGTCKIKAGKTSGKAKLTVTLASGLKKTITVTVQKNAVTASSVKNVPKKITLNRGQKYTLRPNISPITCVQKASYSSAKSKIAKVSSKGVINAKKKGKTKITVKVGKKKATCTVIVK